MAEPRGLFAQVGANGPISLACAVALVKEQIEHLMHAVEPRKKLIGRWDFQPGLMLQETLSRPLQTFFDGFLRHEKGAADFRVAETAQGFQSEGELVFTSEPRVTAGEHHFKLAVLDFFVEK